MFEELRALAITTPSCTPIWSRRGGHGGGVLGAVADVPP
jgi:hypothetical protein